jgi:6-bladed beta-propeller
MACAEIRPAASGRALKRRALSEGTMKKNTLLNFVLVLLAATVLGPHRVSAQSTAPVMNFDSANPLTLPDDIYLGEVGGVATNSRGDIFVYTRTGHPTMSLASARPFVHSGSRLFQFDRTGKYTREIGQGVYGFLFAAQVRVDPQDNLWVVDEYSSMVMKFDPQGRVAFLLGRKPESIQNPGGRAGGGGEGGRGGEAGRGGEGGGRGRGGPPGAGAPQDVFNRPTDVAWDAQGNVFVADGRGTNARVAKFSKDGVFVKSWGQRGAEPGQFASVDSIAVDAQGNVYAADAGNKRIQVFDNNGTFKTEIKNVGNAQAICITPGANQVLYVSNSNPPTDLDTAGEIYKVKLDGSMIGKFGKAGKLPKEFGTVNAIDCRSENTLYVGEVGNFRVQKLTIH